MLFFVLISVEMPTVVGISTFMSRKKIHAQLSNLTQCIWSRFCFLTYMTEFVLFLPVLENYVSQLTRDVKNVIRIPNSRNDVIHALPREKPNDVRRRPLCNVKCHRYKK